MKNYCGVDFGTSNSVISIIGADGSPVSLREPSFLYFPVAQETTIERYCGNEAIERWVGGGMSGRFFQSVKTLLPDPGFRGTTINGKRFSAEDLVAVMLRYLRSAMQEKTGIEIRRALLGRPARFSDKADRDALAQSRLEAAAHQAGFEHVEFELEPVAGAHAFGAHIGRTSMVFVSDHGGGTSDFTIMNISFEPGSLLPTRKEILATHGVRVGGDDFDADIMWEKLVTHFGYGSDYESWGKLLPVPVHIYRTLCRWDQIHLLKTLSYRDDLRYFRRGSTDPAAIERLISLIENDLGYFLFQAIESAKIDLSGRGSSAIRFLRDNIDVDEPLTRREFDAAIQGRLAAVDEAVSQTLKSASLSEREVSNAFLTGGSSRVRALHDLLDRRFGIDRVTADVNRFDSVGIGLAIAARERGLSVA